MWYIDKKILKIMTSFILVLSSFTYSATPRLTPKTQALKESTLMEFQNRYEKTKSLISQMDITGTLKDHVEKVYKNFNSYASKVGAHADKKTINANLEYMQYELENIQQLLQILTGMAAKREPSSLAKAHHLPATASIPLSNQILDSNKIILQTLRVGQSTPLYYENNIVGFVRKFPNGLAIELKGLSQQQNMACGSNTYANAMILRNATNYPITLSQLRNKEIIEQFTQELKSAVIAEQTNIFGPEGAINEWDTMMKQSGITLDSVYQITGSKNLCLGAADNRIFTLFPTEIDIQNLQKANKEANLQFSFYKDIKTINPTARQQKFQLPSTCMILIGDNIERAGHWIAVRFERMSNGQIAIIFADSCPFRREGNKLEPVDKIEAYKNIFDRWFKNMDQFINQ